MGVCFCVAKSDPPYFVRGKAGEDRRGIGGETECIFKGKYKYVEVQIDFTSQFSEGAS